MVDCGLLFVLLDFYIRGREGQRLSGTVMPPRRKPRRSRDMEVSGAATILQDLGSLDQKEALEAGGSCQWRWTVG